MQAWIGIQCKAGVGREPAVHRCALERSGPTRREDNDADARVGLNKVEGCAIEALALGDEAGQAWDKVCGADERGAGVLSEFGELVAALVRESA